MIKHGDVLVAEGRHADFRRDAEIDRLLRTARRAGPRGPRLPRRVFGWLGTRFILWGSRLRYWAGMPGTGASGPRDLARSQW